MSYVWAEIKWKTPYYILIKLACADKPEVVWPRTFFIIAYTEDGNLQGQKVSKLLSDE